MAGAEKRVIGIEEGWNTMKVSPSSASTEFERSCGCCIAPKQQLRVHANLGGCRVFQFMACVT